MTAVVVHTPAKINIGLEILGRRDDGFHEIRTIMQSISIYDRLSLTHAPTIGISCTRPELAGSANLAHRAAASVQERYGLSQGAHIHLEKRIPTAAGLGGASSDAAATLRGSCARWALACADADLSDLAARLGSDVPFFLHGGTMLASGRGDHLTSLPALTDVWFVVATPRVEVANKTPRMYAALDSRHFSDGNSITALTERLASHEPIAWNDVMNGFESVAIDVLPEIDAVRTAFRRAGAPFVLMTGAGPSHFTATPDLEHTESIQARLMRDIGAWADLFLCQPVATVPPVEFV